jgi:hypothetical protein
MIAGQQDGQFVVVERLAAQVGSPLKKPKVLRDAPFDKLRGLLSTNGCARSAHPAEARSAVSKGR